MIDLNGKTILIAEDEEFNYKFLERVLIKLGAEVIRAHNGKEAVELVSSNAQFWILLLDLKMPVMTGYEAVHHIRSAGYRIPVLAVTAYAFSEDREKAIAAGCDDYISKPFEIQDLIELLKKYL
jgi:CheY-like chemotaxis protein